MALSINSLRQTELGNTYTPPKATTTVIPKTTTTTKTPTSLTSYSNDYQAEINRRAVINPNDPTIADLTALRTAKIAANATPPEAGGGTTTLPTAIGRMEVERLKQAQIAANMAALDTALGNQITNIDSQYASIDQNAYSARNVAAGESDVAAMNFAQRAAARGIQGNAASMPEIYRNSALQGRLGDIDQSALANKNILDSQKTQLRNAYESDRVGIQSGAEAQAIQNLIAQQNANRQFALSEAGVTGSYNGTQTMQGQAQMLSNQMAQLNIAAQEIENSYLPQTLKDEATRLQQQVEAGRIDIATALAQLNSIKTSGTTTPKGFTSAELESTIKGLDQTLAYGGSYANVVSRLRQLYDNGQITSNQVNAISSRLGL